MNKAVTFYGINALDFEELRKNAIRVPQVITRVRQAQQLWDKAGLPSFDFLNFLSSEDSVFLSNIKFKSLAAAIVQVGMYDRYMAKNSSVKYLVGDVARDSAVQVAAGIISFADMIYASTAAQASASVAINDVLFSGVKAEKLKVYSLEKQESGEEKYVALQVQDKGLKSLIRLLVDEYSVRDFVNVGPGSDNERLRAQMALEDLRFSESVDDDPMLNWFYECLWMGDYKMAQ